ncbi:MAG: amidase [Planctomycetia bacterium]|nr:amidase [Planctomycetia bacterium]
MAASAVSIAEGVAAGEVRPTAVLAEHVSRHGETHAALNALVQPRHTAALVEAEHLESRLQAGDQVGQLAGVPVSVKECFAVAGLVTSLGIATRRHAVDVADAPIVSCLRAAGAIIVGKGNVPQAMYLHETDNPVWGCTNHPLDATRGPGGSSGGDAALVAAGVVPLAVGTDLAGSIRQPAHACGISGFLPRSAVVGDGGAFDTVPHLSVVRPRAGFLAREVDDLARAFAVVAAGSSSGPDIRNAEATRGGRRHGGLRVAWWDDAGPLAPSPAIRRGVHEAVSRLRQAGVEMVRLDGSLATEAAWLHLALLSADGGADIRRLFAGTRPIPPVARLLRLAGLPIWLRPLLAGLSQTAGGGIEAVALRATGPRRGAALASLDSRRAAFATRFASLVAPYDALVCPVSALPALPHGTAALLLVAAAPCLLANLLDLPAGTVPITRVRPDEELGRVGSRDRVVRAAAAADRGSRNLPVGVQVVGVPGLASADDPLGPERIVLDVMRLIERGQNHHHHNGGVE